MSIFLAKYPRGEGLGCAHSFGALLFSFLTTLGCLKVLEKSVFWPSKFSEANNLNFYTVMTSITKCHGIPVAVAQTDCFGSKGKPLCNNTFVETKMPTP